MPKDYHLLTAENPKMMKATDFGYLSLALHLAPGKLSGVDVCENSSPGCRRCCLNTAGRAGLRLKNGKKNPIQLARIRRTRLYFNDRERFFDLLQMDLGRLMRKARRLDLKAACRLNATSDIEIRLWPVLDEFPEITFYDYTKDPCRMRRWCNGSYPDNYHLTFSRSEENNWYVREFLTRGKNIAVVYMPTGRGWDNDVLMIKMAMDTCSREIVDGDHHDLTFLHNRVIIALKAKGKAKSDRTGFVLREGASSEETVV